MKDANTEKAAGLVHLDARWYNPHSTRFVQPDLWNFASTGLPSEVQHEVMQFAGLNAALLLRDPGQQNRFGYVSSDPLSLTDHYGLGGILNSPIFSPEIYAQAIGQELSSTTVEVDVDIRAGAYIAGTVNKVVGYKVDLGSVSLSDGNVVSEGWTESGYIQSYSDARTEVSASFPFALNVTATNTTTNGGETWVQHPTDIESYVFDVDTVYNSSEPYFEFDIGFIIGIEVDVYVCKE